LQDFHYRQQTAVEILKFRQFAIGKRMMSQLFLLLSLSLLVSCSSGEEEVRGTNIVCAFVEGYFETKVLTLTLPPSDAVDSVQGMTPTPEEIGSSVLLDEEPKQILISLRNALTEWAYGFQDYSVTQDKEDFALAGKTLESEIDKLADQCTDLGWRFPTDWVHNSL